MTTALCLLAVAPNGFVSGAEQVLLDRLDAANSLGWTTMCLRPAGTATARRLDDIGTVGFDLPELRLPAGNKGLAGGRLAARSLLAAHRIRAAAGDADVVVVNGLTALPAVRLARLRCPTCWVVHDVPVRAGYRRLARFSAPAIDSAIAVSTSAAALPRALDVATVVVHNGTPWPVDPAATNGAPPVVGLNGTLTPWKGQAVLLEAAARLPGVRFELMGDVLPKDRGYRNELGRRADEPDLRGRVTFTGHVHAPLERMRGWTVAVSASVAPEAGPLSVLEAMSIGLPTIATDHGGARDYLGDNGLLVPPGDPVSLAEAIGRLLADDALRRRLGAANRQRIADEFRLERSVDTWLSRISTIAAGGRPR